MLQQKRVYLLSLNTEHSPSHLHPNPFIGVLLNQAFINYGIAFLRKRGYTVLQPPFMMKKDVMAGVAQLEQFDEELYKVTGDGEDKYLIATSEQPICALHMNEWMEEKTLPIFYTGAQWGC
jgi:seryl-tRNA synthetase